MEELTEMERLKLSLKYSTSEKHRKLLEEKISKIENKQKIQSIVDEFSPDISNK